MKKMLVVIMLVAVCGGSLRAREGAGDYPDLLNLDEENSIRCRTVPGVEIGCGYFFPVGRSLLGLALSAFKALLPTDIYDLEYNEVRCGGRIGQYFSGLRVW